SLAKVIQGCIWIVGIAATLIALRKGSVYELWFLCSDFVYCILFPQLVLALFDKKANTIGSISGFIVAAILRFGGGEATLGIPDFFEYHNLFNTPELVDGKKVLFPFRTLAMVSSFITIIVVSRLTQKINPPKPLEKIDG
ncbi:MAG: sodium:solute symporter, partial [Bdellovibrionota bacterium]|nr:sodium:solute symporter [Bdellovibrionota bacterium]